MDERTCLNCVKFDPDMFDENKQEVAGYCTDTERLKLKYASDSCDKHKFKRGAKKK